MASSLGRLDLKGDWHGSNSPLYEQQSVLREPERSPVRWVRGRGVTLLLEGRAGLLLVRRHCVAHLVGEDGANHDVVKLDLP